MNILSGLVLAGLLLSLAYTFILVMGAMRQVPCTAAGCPKHRFLLAVPAHDESGIIGKTIAALRQLDYPVGLFDVYVVADHCSDGTANVAREAGAHCFERTEGPRSGKAAALGWLFERMWEDGAEHDAVVVFDADTQVDKGFLRAMDARLEQGEQVIQGQHRIRNPRDGWYPALSWVMFVIDNRINNQGRANLGLSAKNMGDSICLRADLLRRLGWGAGLTEDYELRMRLLEQGYRIAYEPRAIGYGEAPANWAIARKQRERWLAGTYQSSRSHLGRMVRLCVRRPTPALVDAVLQAILPAYSTLLLAATAGLLAQVLVNLVAGPVFARPVVLAWAAGVGLLLAYPWVGLALERAPWWAYVVSLSGPLFVVWRTALALTSRFGRRAVEWVRTPRSGSGA